LLHFLSYALAAAGIFFPTTEDPVSNTAEFDEDVVSEEAEIVGARARAMTTDNRQQTTDNRQQTTDNIQHTSDKMYFYHSQHQHQHQHHHHDRYFIVQMMHYQNRISITTTIS